MKALSKAVTVKAFLYQGISTLEQMVDNLISHTINKLPG